MTVVLNVESIPLSIFLRQINFENRLLLAMVIMKRTPEFWHESVPSLKAKLLSPIAWLWHMGDSLHIGVKGAKPNLSTLALPVVCVGGAVMGGSGKTPVIELLDRLARQAGLKPLVISRGYGGKTKEDVWVNPQQFSSHKVGDEPMMLAQNGLSVVVSPRRAKRLPLILSQAKQMGYDLALLDDGLQNPWLSQMANARILVWDGESGIGNGKIFPAGPLRRPLAKLFPDLDMIFIIKANRVGAEALSHSLEKEIMPPSDSPQSDSPQSANLREFLKNCQYYRQSHRQNQTLVVMGYWHLSLAMRPSHWPSDKQLLGFAGIGRPQKFFKALLDEGIILTESLALADHQVYDDGLITKLKDYQARDYGLVTTAKDAVKLPNDIRQDCWVVKGEIIPIPTSQNILQDWLVKSLKEIIL